MNQGGHTSRIEEVEAFGFKSAFHQPREAVDHSILGTIPKLEEFGVGVPPKVVNEQ